MVFTSIKTTFQKAPPKVIIHHDMKWFDKSAFKSELAQKYTTKDSMSYLHFENTFMNVYGQKLQIFQKYHAMFLDYIILHNITWTSFSILDHFKLELFSFL